MNYEYDFQGLSGVVSNLDCHGNLSTRESPRADIPQKTVLILEVWPCNGGELEGT